ncbi:MAG: flagellar assembly factor FliW [Nitrospirales bacterium]|nr:MAG: flagellar assembly factor FliW [Nitrospirales bacterium]
MKVATSRFGEVEVTEESMVTFPSGLVGLPNYVRYVVFDVEQDSGYQWLQSLEDETLAVVIMPADVLEPEFANQITEESVLDLNLTADDQVSISVIVTIPPGQPDLATANFRAPIVVNLRTRLGKQIILHESLPLHVPLMPGDSEESNTPAGTCLQEAMKT